MTNSSSQIETHHHLTMGMLPEETGVRQDSLLTKRSQLAFRPSFSTQTRVSPPPSPPGQPITPSNALKHASTYRFGISPGKVCARRPRVVRQSDDNDTLAVTKAEAGQVTVRSAGSLAASKNAKLDHQLTFSEFMYAKNLFLTAIDNAKWGDDTTDSFNWFFHNLDNHPMREEGTAERERCCFTHQERAWTGMTSLRSEKLTTSGPSTKTFSPK
jgi:hypothetical protein